MSERQPLAPHRAGHYLRGVRVVVLLALALLCCEKSSPPSAAAPTARAASAAPERSSAPAPSASAAAPERWLVDRLRASDPRLSKWIDRGEELRLQILVSAVEAGPRNEVRFTEHGFRVDAEYVYPASAIKTLLAIAALRALPRLAKANGASLDVHTTVRRCVDDVGRCEIHPHDEDEPDEDGTFTVAGEIHKLLSYSDNDSYERLYDLLGHRELNADMAALGLSSVRFHHRMGAPAERSKETPRVLFYPKGTKPLEIARRTSDLQLAETPATKLSLGAAYRDGRTLVEEPMSFAEKNYVSMRELHLVLRSIVLPDSPGAIALGIDDDARAVLMRAMTGKLVPRKNAQRHKPLLAGVLRVVDAEDLRYVNKSGRAYGFHLDNAFIEDGKSRRSFFVTAVVYANPNGVLNDDDYAYEETSEPLLEALGEALARALLRP